MRSEIIVLNGSTGPPMFITKGLLCRKISWYGLVFVTDCMWSKHCSWQGPCKFLDTNLYPHSALMHRQSYSNDSVKCLQSLDGLCSLYNLIHTNKLHWNSYTMHSWFTSEGFVSLTFKFSEIFQLVKTGCNTQSIFFPKIRWLCAQATKRPLKEIDRVLQPVFTSRKLSED